MKRFDECAARNLGFSVRHLFVCLFVWLFCSYTVPTSRRAMRELVIYSGFPGYLFTRYGKATFGPIDLRVRSSSQELVLRPFFLFQLIVKLSLCRYELRNLYFMWVHPNSWHATSSLMTMLMLQLGDGFVLSIYGLSTGLYL